MVKRVISRIGRRRPFQLFVREWMDSKGLDQDTMAERMDCAPGTLSKLLNNNMKWTTEWLARAAYALGEDVQVTDLYRHPDRPTQDDLLRGLPVDEQLRIVKAIRALTGTDR